MGQVSGDTQRHSGMAKGIDERCGAEVRSLAGLNSMH